MKCLPVLLLNPSAFNARATERSESPALRSLRAAVSTFLARSDGARADILRRVTHKPPPEVFEGYTTFEWEVVCREVVKLDVVGTGAPRCLATVLATVPSQLPVFAMKRAMALPGLEPGRPSFRFRLVNGRKFRLRQGCHRWAQARRGAEHPMQADEMDPWGVE